MEERRAVRHPGAFLAKSEPDQDARGVRADVDAGADLAEQARLLVDLHVEAGLQQADRGGEPADAAADDGDGASSGSAASCDALAAHLVVARDRAGAVGRRENGASGGFIRASAGSPWMCASSAFTPDTSGLPSNSLRIVTAASSAALSPLLQAQLAKIGVEIGGRRDAAGEGAGARIEQHRFGRRKHVEALRDRRGLARIVHVAGGILQARRCGVPKRVEQALHQRDVPVQAGLLRVVIEIDRDRLLRASPSRWCRYRRPGRRPARPCNRTAAAPARRQSPARRHSASAPPRRPRPAAPVPTIMRSSGSPAAL